MTRISPLLVLVAVAATLPPPPQALAADTPDVAVCNAAFAQGISDNWNLFTERQQFEAYQFRLCQAKFSSYTQFRSTASSLGLDIPLAEGLLGLAGNTEERSSQFSTRYDKLCTSTYFTASDHERYESYISQVSSALLQSWNRCQELYLQAYLQAKGVFASVTPMGHTEEFVSRIQIRTEIVGEVSIEAIHPDGKVVCYRGGVQIKPKTKIPIRDFSLTCHKDPTVEIAFNVETNFGQSNQVKVPSGTQRLAEVLGNIEALRSEITEQAKRLSHLERTLPDRIELTDCGDANPSFVRPQKDGKWVSCPNGKVGVAINSRLDYFDGSPEYNFRCCRVELHRP